MLDFDRVLPRRNSDSVKWGVYPDDVLPMWVADMDFLSPTPIIEALQQRAAHGIYGYGMADKALFDVVCARLQQLYNWQVSPQDIILLPGLVTGLNVSCRMLTDDNAGVVVQTPIYPPFLSAPHNQGKRLLENPLQLQQDGKNLFYTIDFEGFKSALAANARLFLLCHPHNPVGRAFTREELTQLAEQCERHDVWVCSDEIHADLLLNDRTHIPFATLSPSIAQRTITLIAPSKTFNIAGLGCSFAIIQNPKLRQLFERAMAGIVPELNFMALQAGLVAYQHPGCATWLQALLQYLRTNRDIVDNFVQTRLTNLRSTLPEATYLTWLDCRALPIDNPYQFFLQQAKVAFNPGDSFGTVGQGFVRLNFGCPRATLENGLQRMEQALATL